MGGNSASFSTTTTKTDTLTANAEGTVVIGSGARYRVTDSKATADALKFARQVSRDGIENNRRAFDLVLSANRQIGTSSASALEQVAASKTDGGQTERLAKIAGVVVAIIAGVFLLRKK